MQRRVVESDLARQKSKTTTIRIEQLLITLWLRAAKYVAFPRSIRSLTITVPCRKHGRILTSFITILKRKARSTLLTTASFIVVRKLTLKYLGDNDPVDLCEIGSTTLNTGDVVQVKVLGGYAMIDGGNSAICMSWRYIIMTRN